MPRKAKQEPTATWERNTAPMIAANRALSAEQRSERARKANKARYSIANYVKAIVARAPELTADDLAALRAVIGPLEAPAAYEAGLKVGAKMAIGRMMEDLTRLAGGAA